MIEVGDVIVFYTSHTNPPKPKFHVCVAVSEGYFFRLNSKSHFLCSFPISQQENPFLDHDSFVECGSLIEYCDYAIDEALVDGPGKIGKLSKASIEALKEYCGTLATLNEADRQLIVAEMQAFLDS